MKDIEGARQELEELMEALQQLEQRQEQRIAALRGDMLRSDSAQELAALRADIATALDDRAAVIHELSQRCSAVEGRLEQQHSDLSSSVAAREMLEARVREGQ